MLNQEQEDNIDDDYNSSSSLVSPSSPNHIIDNENGFEEDMEHSDIHDLIQINSCEGGSLNCVNNDSCNFINSGAKYVREKDVGDCDSRERQKLVPQINMTRFERLVHDSALNVIIQLKKQFSNSDIQNPGKMITNIINILSSGNLRICIHGATQPARIQCTEVSLYEKIKVIRMFIGPMNVWIYFSLNHLLVFTDFASICSSTLFSSIYDYDELPSMVRDKMMFMNGNQGPEIIICNLDARSICLYEDENNDMINQETYCLTDYPDGTGEWWTTYSYSITYGKLQMMNRPNTYYSQSRPQNTNIG